MFLAFPQKASITNDIDTWGKKIYDFDYIITIGYAIDADDVKIAEVDIIKIRGDKIPCCQYKNPDIRGDMTYITHGGYFCSGVDSNRRWGLCYNSSNETLVIGTLQRKHNHIYRLKRQIVDHTLLQGLDDLQNKKDVKMKEAYNFKTSNYEDIDFARISEENQDNDILSIKVNNQYFVMLSNRLLSRITIRGINISYLGEHLTALWGYNCCSCVCEKPCYALTTITTIRYHRILIVKDADVPNINKIFNIIKGLGSAKEKNKINTKVTVIA